jgi:hypothetical protein
VCRMHCVLRALCAARCVVALCAAHRSCAARVVRPPTRISPAAV